MMTKSDDFVFPLPLPAVAATIAVLAEMPFTAEEIVDILAKIENSPTIYEQLKEEGRRE